MTLIDTNQMVLEQAINPGEIICGYCANLDGSRGMVQSMLLRLVFGTLSLRHHQFYCGYINTRTRKQRKHFVALVNFGKNCSLP